MNKDTILKSDVLDILFDNRNKAYGAYDLRKFYNNRLTKSLAVMLTGVVVLSAFTFLPKEKVIDNKLNVTDIITCPIADFKKEEPKQEKIKQNVKQQPTDHSKLLNNIKITNKPNDADTLKTIDDKTAIGSINVTLPGNGPSNPPLVIPVGTGDGGEPKGKPAEPVVDITKTYGENEVEVAPSYPGGMDALRKFLERNLTNPRDMEEDEAVSVQVKFVVGYDGKLQKRKKSYKDEKYYQLCYGYFFNWRGCNVFISNRKNEAFY
ncbi:MAG: hypothetical protein IPP48_02050 [Chitinophagaceae bacterium]|nr:hypothetical protein [Chitinophagaceae bacterium]